MVVFGCIVGKLEQKVNITFCYEDEEV